MEWSSTVEDYYPIDPRSRHGHGQPAHAAISRYLARSDFKYLEAIAHIGQARDLLHEIPFDYDAASPTRPFWNNGWFSVLDAAALVGFILHQPPKRYIEIGSGHSTLFARHAINISGAAARIVSVDPHPRAEIDALCDEVIRSGLEDCDLSLFDRLEAGDILFFDGSHRVFMNSDVTVFFLEVLPRLKPGVLVHLHDMFLPEDYPPVWSRRLYSEQYILAAMLLCGSPPFEVVLPNYYACKHPLLSLSIQRIFEAHGDGHPIPFNYPNDAGIPGVSMWLRTTEQK